MAVLRPCVALAACVAICGAAKPQSSVGRLRAGESGVIARSDLAFLVIRGGKDGAALLDAAVGDRVLVVDDPGYRMETDEEVQSRAFDADTQEEADAIRDAGPRRLSPPDPKSGMRMMRVRIIGGPLDGREGEITRRAIRAK